MAGRIPGFPGLGGGEAEPEKKKRWQEDESYKRIAQANADAWTKKWYAEHPEYNPDLGKGYIGRPYWKKVGEDEKLDLDLNNLNNNVPALVAEELSHKLIENGFYRGGEKGDTLVEVAGDEILYRGSSKELIDFPDFISLAMEMRRYEGSETVTLEFPPDPQHLGYRQLDAVLKKADSMDPSMGLRFDKNVWLAIGRIKNDNKREDIVKRYHELNTKVKTQQVERKHNPESGIFSLLSKELHRSNAERLETKYPNATTRENDFKTDLQLLGNPPVSPDRQIKNISDRLESISQRAVQVDRVEAEIKRYYNIFDEEFLKHNTHVTPAELEKFEHDHSAKKAQRETLLDDELKEAKDLQKQLEIMKPELERIKTACEAPPPDPDKQKQLKQVTDVLGELQKLEDKLAPINDAHIAKRKTKGDTLSTDITTAKEARETHQAQIQP